MWTGSTLAPFVTIFGSRAGLSALTKVFRNSRVGVDCVCRIICINSSFFRQSVVAEADRASKRFLLVVHFCPFTFAVDEV
jgi:hypothetical protein